MIEELKRVPIFAVLSDEELRLVGEEGAEARVPRGGVSAREGDPIEHLYVLLEGELWITKKVEDGEMVINTYTPGTFFGEVPLLAGTPFLASGRALTDCRLFLLPEATFRRLLASSATFSKAILETMAQRVQILRSVAQQRHRLNSLGTLAAGLAHELNNPAAASRRAASRLRESFGSSRASDMSLVRSAVEGSLGPAQLDALEEMLDDALERGTDPPQLAPLEQSEREEELVTWLEGHGVEDGWDLAPALAVASLDVAALDALAGAVSPNPLPEALRYLEATFEATEALDEVQRGTARLCREKLAAERSALCCA
jgi:CRP-like cAMP-binding protein